MRRGAIGWVGTGFALALVAPSTGAAHSKLVYPPPRSEGTGLTTGPCGDIVAGDAKTTFTAGETINVIWHLEVSHGGYMDVGFSSENDEGFRQNVLAQRVAEDAAEYQVEVALPECRCSTCRNRVCRNRVRQAS